MESDNPTNWKSGELDSPAGPSETYSSPWKRELDLLLLLILSPVVLPVGCIIALYIKAVSRGPVLFSQTRIGLKGKPFTCFKFRSMKVNSCVEGHVKHLEKLIASDKPMTKLDNSGDRRLIPGGRLLRASGLDELAQLLNVARGEMSIVGPRPCLPYEFALYSEHHMRRLNCLPGITGLWQVSGKNETTFEQMVAIDIEYATRRSVGLDLSIVFRTFFVLIKQIFDTLRKKNAVSVGSDHSVPDSSKRDLVHAHAKN